MGSPSYLSCKDATEADDDEDVEDSRAHDGTHAHIAPGDEHSCSRGTRDNINAKSQSFIDHSKICARENLAPWCKKEKRRTLGKIK